MPIKPNANESKDDFVSRCISVEMNNGMEQNQAIAVCISKSEEYFAATGSVSDATWSTEAPININLDSYTDYPKEAQENAKTALRWVEENGWGDCATSVGKARANQLANGEAISRDTIARMAAFERHRQNSKRDLGDGCGRLSWLAWGGDAGVEWAQRKLKQIDSQKLSRVKKVLFDEDFDLERLQEYKDMGFKVYVRSKRKIKKKDKKVWNKLKTAGLSQDDLLYGEISQLDKHHDFYSIEIGNEPILEKLLATAQSIKGKKILKTFDIENMEQAEAAQLELKNVELKFVTVKVYYTYELRDDVSGPKVIPTTREFCRRLIDEGDKAWTLDQIKNLSGAHLTKMGLPNDVFQFRGGYYRVKGTLNTTPFCRHIWRAKVVIE